VLGEVVVVVAMVRNTLPASLQSRLNVYHERRYDLDEVAYMLAK
jgi:hypothetical protein